jgi:hypothetical protein
MAGMSSQSDLTEKEETQEPGDCSTMKLQNHWRDAQCRFAEPVAMSALSG